MFSNLREKISDKLAAASLALTGDDNDRLIADIVARATSEELIAPEWSLNHSLIDLVNLNPNNSSLMAEKLFKALKRPMHKNNAKTQILTLTILEACIKNSYPVVYGVLAKSDLWVDLMKMAVDKSVERIDAEVRDRILCMTEDYANILPQPEFRESYELLLEHGIDFPVRGPEDQPPILTPPYRPPPASRRHTGGTLGGTALTEAGYAPPLEQQGVPEEDPFAGMSEEDRLAVQAAMAEMDQEARAVRESTALAASTALFEQMAQQQQQQQHAPGTNPQQPNLPQGSPPVSAAPAIPPRPPAPVLPDNIDEALQVISNSTGLLNEMLASETDPREGFVAELAEQCVRMKSRLEEIIGGLVDEGQLASSLAQHEALQAATSKYDELLARAEQGGVVAAPPAAGLQQRPFEQQLQSISQAHSPAGRSPQPGLAGPNFSLLGEDDEEEAEEDLSSKRVAGTRQQPPPEMSEPTAASGVSGQPPPPAPSANLIDLLDGPPAAASAATTSNLMDIDFPDGPQVPTAVSTLDDPSVQVSALDGDDVPTEGHQTK